MLTQKLRRLGFPQGCECNRDFSTVRRWATGLRYARCWKDFSSLLRLALMRGRAFCLKGNSSMSQMATARPSGHGDSGNFSNAYCLAFTRAVRSRRSPNFNSYWDIACPRNCVVIRSFMRGSSSCARRPFSTRGQIHFRPVQERTNQLLGESLDFRQILDLRMHWKT